MFRGVGIQEEGKLKGGRGTFVLSLRRYQVEWLLHTYLLLPITVLSAVNTAMNKTDKVPNLVVYILGID